MKKEITMFESKSWAIQPYKEVINSMIDKERGSLKWLNLIDLGYIPKDLFDNLRDFESFDIFKGYKSVEVILKEIEGLNRKGFVNNSNIFDDFDYPILSNYSKLFLNKEGKKLLNKDKKLLSLDNKIDLGKWSYNLIMIELLYILEVGLKKTSLGLELLDKTGVYSGEESLNLSDLIEEYKVLIRVVMSKIEPSIKHKIQKGGITVIHNTYTGFDTEYQNIDLKYNELLSVQLAINNKISLKIPMVKDYDFSNVDTLSGKIYPIKVDYKGLIDYKKIGFMINEGIKSIRSLKYNDYDSSITKIINMLKDKKVSYTEIEEKSCIFFSFERTPITTWFNVVDEEGISFQELVRKSNGIAQGKINIEWLRILKILKDIHNDQEISINEETEIEEENILKNIEKSIDSEKTMNLLNLDEKQDKIRKYTRTRMQSFSKEVISVTEVKNNYFIGHLTRADLSLLKDFEYFKDDLDIINGCFVTISKPILIDGVNVYIRDTMLLAPGSKKSLAAIGSLYDKKLNKIQIYDRIKNMKLFLKEEPVLFEEYAIQDSVITLIHACFMEDFNFRIGSVGIPLTLSTLSRNYILNKWRLLDYKGYQITHDFLLGDASKSQTPKGLNLTSTTGVKMSLYISNYKGGRNESFMYGIDNETIWIDYDLTSAYTTAMAMLGDPCYSKGRIIKEEELLKMSKNDILYSYTAIKCSFKFPDSVKYPSIPCYLDKTTTFYPLKGSAILTGPEYLLAIEQDCVINIEEIYHIPFTRKILGKEEVIVKPFEGCIRELQSKRRIYPKGSINNLIYKDIGNSIYGLTVKGMGNNMKYDIKSKQTIRMNSGILSNPIIASWTTALIRSVIGELLHDIQKLEGKIVSVTTDGFLTNIKDLESVVQGIKHKEDFSLFVEFKKMRCILSNNDTGLEIKKTTKGIVSWSTRGQFSKEGELKASTGFQNKDYTFDELDILFKDTMNSEGKKLDFVQTSLRSAIDIYKKGGHVTPTYSDRIFRMWFDNRRTIKIPLDLVDYFKDSNKIDYSNILLDSNPLKDLDEGKLYRFYGNLNKTTIYEKKASNKVSNVYKSYLDLAIRNFLKGLMNNSYNLKRDLFENYKDIIDYIHQYKPTYKLTPNILAQMKRKGVIKRPVLKNNETLDFVEYIKIKFPNFDEDLFFKK